MFDSGICTICDKTEVSVNGLMPVERLSPTVSNVFYGDRTVSYTRLYEARGADSQIDKLIRIPAEVSVFPDMYVLIGDDQYRVDAVSDVIVARSTRAKELTLVKLEDYYDITTS